MWSLMVFAILLVNAEAGYKYHRPSQLPVAGNQYSTYQYAQVPYSSATVRGYSNQYSSPYTVQHNQNSLAAYAPQHSAQYSTSQYNTVQYSAVPAATYNVHAAAQFVQQPVNVPVYPVPQPVVHYQTQQAQPVLALQQAPQPVYQTQQLQQVAAPAYTQQVSQPFYQTQQVQHISQPANTPQASQPVYQTQQVQQIAQPAYTPQVSQPVYQNQHAQQIAQPAYTPQVAQSVYPSQQSQQVQLVQQAAPAQYVQQQAVSDQNVENVAKLSAVTIDVDHHEYDDHEHSDHHHDELVKFQVDEAGYPSHHDGEHHDLHDHQDHHDHHEHVAKLTSVTIDVHKPSGDTDLHANEQHSIPVNGDVPSVLRPYSQSDQLHGAHSTSYQYHNNAPALVTKHVYFHVPPADIEEQQRAQQVLPPPPPPKKNYKIIFIKAPSQDSRNTALIQQQLQSQLAAASEEKTLIYVLSKKLEPQEIVQPTVPPTVINKPEVFYVKYKNNTPLGEVVNQISEQH